jgi:hypothetical protein
MKVKTHLKAGQDDNTQSNSSSVYVSVSVTQSNAINPPPA